MAPFDTHHQETEEYKRYMRKRKFKRKLITILVVLILLCGVIGGIWLHGRSHGKQETEQTFLIPTADPAPASGNITITLDTLYSEIRDIGELATVEYLFTDAAKFSDSKKIKDWDIPFTEKSFVLKWDGVIKAGILVEEIQIEVLEAEKKILVTLPQAQILSYSVDADSVEILDEKNNLLNEITVSDKLQFDADTEAAMRQRAIDNGILEKARENAERIIEKLLTANPAVKENYTIVFIQS